MIWKLIIYVKDMLIYAEGQFNDNHSNQKWLQIKMQSLLVAERSII